MAAPKKSENAEPTITRIVVGSLKHISSGGGPGENIAIGGQVQEKKGREK